jgi:hypothetical protein
MLRVQVYYVEWLLLLLKDLGRIIHVAVNNIDSMAPVLQLRQLSINRRLVDATRPVGG